MYRNDKLHKSNGYFPAIVVSEKQKIGKIITSINFFKLIKLLKTDSWNRRKIVFFSRTIEKKREFGLK